MSTCILCTTDKDHKEHLYRENAFTDDDLIEFIHKYGHLSHCAALIARFKAAEDVITSKTVNDRIQKMKAWRAKAGKS